MKVRHCSLLTAHCFLLVILSPSVAQAYEFDNTPVTTCWNEGGIIDFTLYDDTNEGAYFDKNQCKNVESNKLERNAFMAYGAPEMEKINTVMQDKLHTLWLDQGGHGEALVGESINLYRTYNYCLESLCQLIARDCGSDNLASDSQANRNRCLNRKDRLLELSQAQIRMQVESNVERKTRSLFVEKMSALSLRFDKWLHPRLRHVNRNIARSANSILALARETWSR